ncbi:ribosomal protein L7/L12 [Nocardioides cynanchi]|uniref:ribosomal protein L7/L12 n=1 Tax=Nocardioides cynanchi TaxID=2558918 RepID=UPI0012462F58|nr:ribosomal protein L7/L12 [Nocardioides cynanchi]
MGLFGGTPDRGELLDLQARVGRLEEQVARLSAALSASAPVLGGAGATTAPAPAVAAPDAYAEARALATAGRKIDAIKVVREQSGISLKAAKDLVESW